MEDCLFLYGKDLYKIAVLCMSRSFNLSCEKCPLNSSKDDEGVCVAQKAYKKSEEGETLFVPTYAIMINNISDPDVKKLAIKWKNKIDCIPWYNGGY